MQENYFAKFSQRILSSMMIVNENFVGVRFTTLGGPMNGCKHCGAIIWPLELPSICCNHGKVKLNPVPDPPQLLKTLWEENSERSKLFRENVAP